MLRLSKSLSALNLFYFVKKREKYITHMLPPRYDKCVTIFENLTQLSQVPRSHQTRKFLISNSTLHLARSFLESHRGIQGLIREAKSHKSHFFSANSQNFPVTTCIPSMHCQMDTRKCEKPLLPVRLRFTDQNSSCEAWLKMPGFSMSASERVWNGWGPPAADRSSQVK